jgi:hypothetical protein
MAFQIPDTWYMYNYTRYLYLYLVYVYLVLDQKTLNSYTEQLLQYVLFPFANINHYSSKWYSNQYRLAVCLLSCWTSDNTALLRSRLALKPCSSPRFVVEYRGKIDVWITNAKQYAAFLAKDYARTAEWYEQIPCLCNG